MEIIFNSWLRITNAKLAISELQKSTVSTSCWEAIWHECLANTNSTESQLIEYSDIIANAVRVSMIYGDIMMILTKRYWKEKPKIPKWLWWWNTTNNHQACRIRQGLNMIIFWRMIPLWWTWRRTIWMRLEAVYVPIRGICTRRVS